MKISFPRPAKTSLIATAFIIGCSFLDIHAIAAGIPASVVARRGLTPSQLDALMQRHPNGTVRITTQDWRAMQYEVFRFANVTNWIDSISSNGVAKTMLDLKDDADAAETARRVAEAARRAAETAREKLQDLYTVATNNVAIAERRAQAAERRAARLDSLRAWLVEQRDKALLPSTKAIYQALIDKIDEKENQP